jgi:hypothetical protein
MNIKLVVIGILINCFIMAAPVNLSKAERVAENIYLERSKTNSIEGFGIKSTEIMESDNQKLIYVFQLENNGFIMVSGDDRVQPLLAYSFESSLITDNMPTTLSWMLDAYKEMVFKVSRSNESTTEKNK